jgi:hypothetical protein
MSNKPLFQQRLEVGNQLVNKIHKLMERWEKRITLRNLRLADRFIDFELHILFHLRVKDTGEIWGACLE